MEREEDVLEVRHLSIRFGSIGVLRDLTFHVPAGTTLAILGPNGAGKTVLFKALIGAIAHEGDIEWKAGTGPLIVSVATATFLVSLARRPL
jgi:zinc transport system ATP-binding protein